jgi:hypothetical protein
MGEKPISFLRSRRFLLTSLVALIAISAIAFSKYIRPFHLLSAFSLTSEPLEITVDDISDRTSEPIISIEGETNQPSKVVLYIGDELVGRTVTGRRQRQSWSAGLPHTAANGFIFSEVPA